MNNSDHKIIVIGRQYGGTGRKTGRALAERLGIPYYDKEIINKVAASYGFDPDILDRADEKKPSPFRSMLLGKYGVMDMYSTSPLSREALYEAQTNVIRQICQEGSCVIVGRTADTRLGVRVLAILSGLLQNFSLFQRRYSRIMRRGFGRKIRWKVFL